MERSVIIAGFGGQGVILAGKILAQAGMDHGLEVTWLPSYGPEMRGGTANCTVVLSDDPVGSPIVDEPTGLIALNRPSLDKFEPTVSPDAAIIINASLIQRKAQRDDVRPHYVPVNDIATQLGMPKAINMVALGAYIAGTKAVPLDAVTEAMSRMMKTSGKEKFIEANARALKEGYHAIES